MTGLAAIAAWTGPALVVAVVARVVLGGVEAPLFVLAALAAPLLALLAGSPPRGAPSGPALAAAIVTVACALGAGLRAVVDLGRLLGLDTWTALVAATALVLAVTLWPKTLDVGLPALALGAGALVVATLALGAAVAEPPWTSWSRTASRVAFELGPHSAWTQEGARPLAPLTLTFTEPHRVTASTGGVYRVTERDRGTAVVRDRPLAAGESLTLRPGDSLSIPAGARVRFEAGKRLPGGLPSGVAWADHAGAPGPRLVLEWLGLVVTLAGGALAIVRPAAPPSRPAVLAGPIVVLGVVWAAVCWGVYAVRVAPELSIGAPPVAPLALLAPLVVSDPWRTRLLAAVVVALVALLLASAVALRRRLLALADLGPGRLATVARQGAVGTVTWIVLVGAAAAGGVAVADGWALLQGGAGLATAILLGPSLATGDAAGMHRACAAGALAGAALFVAILAWAPSLASPTAVVVQYPALVAAPGAWLVAALARREMVAAVRRR